MRQVPNAENDGQSAGARSGTDPGASDTAPQTQCVVDQEVHRLIEEAHAQVTALLSGHGDQREGLIRALLQAETGDAADADAYAAAGVAIHIPEVESDMSARSGNWIHGRPVNVLR
jgi:ATP-dependent Zn protease